MNLIGTTVYDWQGLLAGGRKKQNNYNRVSDPWSRNPNNKKPYFTCILVAMAIILAMAIIQGLGPVNPYCRFVTHEDSPVIK